MISLNLLWKMRRISPRRRPAKRMVRVMTLGGISPVISSSSTNDLFCGSVARALAAAATVAVAWASDIFTISSHYSFASSSTATRLAVISNSATARSSSIFRLLNSKIRSVYFCVILGHSCVASTWIVPNELGMEDLLGEVGLLRVF